MFTLYPEAVHRAYVKNWFNIVSLFNKPNIWPLGFRPDLGTLRPADPPIIPFLLALGHSYIRT